MSELDATARKLIFKIVEERQSCAVLGPAGTGKSSLITAITKILETQHECVVSLCAPTGFAANSIGGKTIFKATGLQPKHVPTDRAKINPRRLPKTAFWEQSDVVIIDEVSMLGRTMFEVCDTQARAYCGDRHRRKKPFGGTVVLVFGDFLQLAPIKDEFAFQSPLWEQVFGDNVFHLEKVYRQSDPTFVETLMRIRVGAYSRELDEPLVRAALTRGREAVFPQGIRPTRIYGKNADVDAENEKKLDNLPGPVFPHALSAVFFPLARPNGTVRQYSEPEQAHAIEDCLKKLTVRKKTYLKFRTQVVLCKNLNDTLVNGSRGIVVGFTDSPPYYPIVQFLDQDCPMVVLPTSWEFPVFNEEARVKVTGVPLRLGYATTVHSSQGMSIDCAVIRASDFWAEGQVYVALSRVRSAKGLYLESFDPRKIKAHPKALAFCKRKPAPENSEDGRSNKRLKV